VSKRARSKPRVPRAVWVGPYPITIEFEDARGNDEADYGVFDPPQLKITLRSDVAPANLLNSALHEFWHALHFAAALGDESSEEDFANETPIVYQQARYDKRNRAWWRWLDWLHAEAEAYASVQVVDPRQPVDQ
jgi:hypothetical protein